VRGNGEKVEFHGSLVIAQARIVSGKGMNRKGLN
jgi:hypothetical protein